MNDAKLNESNGDAKTESKPEPVDAEVVKIPSSTEMKKWYAKVVKPKDNGFHLTPENINLGAIDMTQKAGYKIEDTKVFMEIFKLMKRIIVTGE